MNLDELIAEVDVLRGNVMKYTAAFSQAEDASVFVKKSWGPYDEIPFQKPITRMEIELKRIRDYLGKISATPSSDLHEALYDMVTPRYKTKHHVPDEALWDSFTGQRWGSVEYMIDIDSITYFLRESHATLMNYSDGDDLFAETLIKDRFLTFLVGNVLRESRLFNEETMSRASEQLVSSMEHMLRNMQAMYDFDVEGTMRSYNAILDKARIFCEEDGVIGLYHGVAPREIPSLKKDSQSHFRINKSANPEFVQRRGQIAGNNDGSLDLIQKLSASNDWPSLLMEIAQYVRREKEEDIDRYSVVEFQGYNGGVPVLKGIKYRPVSISDIIGQEENVKIVGRNLYAFAEGRQIPRMLLIGGPGVGKTLSLRALVKIHPELRLVLMRSGHISNLESVLEALSKVKYQVVAYVDDMHFGMGFDFEGYKTTTSGMKDVWPKNVALVATINPESYTDHQIPPSVKSRFGIVVDFGTKIDERIHPKVFESICRREGFEYSKEFYQSFAQHVEKEKRSQKTAGKSLPINGRMMEDYIIGQKAVMGIEFPEELR